MWWSWALKNVLPSLSLEWWSALWLSMYLECSLAMLSLICRLETSGESSFFLHLLGLWMSALGCLLLIIFLIVQSLLWCFWWSQLYYWRCFFLGELHFNHCIILLVETNVLGDVGSEVAKVQGDHLDACEGLNLFWSFKWQVLIEVFKLDCVTSVRESIEGWG